MDIQEVKQKKQYLSEKIARLLVDLKTKPRYRFRKLDLSGVLYMTSMGVRLKKVV